MDWGAIAAREIDPIASRARMPRRAIERAGGYGRPTVINDGEQMAYLFDQPARQTTYFFIRLVLGLIHLLFPFIQAIDGAVSCLMQRGHVRVCWGGRPTCGDLTSRQACWSSTRSGKNWPNILGR